MAWKAKARMIAPTMAMKSNDVVTCIFVVLIVGVSFFSIAKLLPVQSFVKRWSRILTIMVIANSYRTGAVAIVFYDCNGSKM